MILAASQLWRINLLVRECAADESRITPQMFLQEIDASAVHCHHRRVGHFDALSGRQFETSMLAFRVAASGNRFEEAERPAPAGFPPRPQTRRQAPATAPARQ